MTDVSALEFQTLTDYYLSQKDDNMPALRKIAVEQKVTFSYEWFLHKHMRCETAASYNFTTYTCLIQADPKYYGNYIDIMLNKLDVKEEVVETCLEYIRSGLLPYQLWIDKVISDLGDTEYYSRASLPSLLLVYLCQTMRTSLIGYMKLHKALLEQPLDEDLKDVVSLAYSQYIEVPKKVKEQYMNNFKSDNEVIRRKFMDAELQLFATTLIDMTQFPIMLDVVEKMEKGEVPPGTQFWTPPLMPIPPIENNSRLELSLDSDEEDIVELEIEPEPVKATYTKPEPVEYKGTDVKEYIVEKVALQGSHRVMSRNKFKTKAEAENFIEDVFNAVPSIVNSFMFTINGTPYKIKGYTKQ